MTSRLKSSENDQSTNTVVERLRSKPEMTVTDQVYMTEVIYPILSQRHYEYNKIRSREDNLSRPSHNLQI